MERDGSILLQSGGGWYMVEWDRIRWMNDRLLYVGKSTEDNLQMLTYEPVKIIFNMLYLLSLVLSLYGGIENLFKRRISVAGMDTILLFLFQVFDKNAIKRISGDRGAIRQLGLFLLANSIVGIWLLPEFFGVWS